MAEAATWETITLTESRWYKGNIHTHTTESDGDASPEEVVRWYRKHGYDFLVLSDHNHLTIFEYGKGRRKFKSPLLIPGEEVSARIMKGTVPIHLGAIGISRVVEPVHADSVVQTIQANVNAIIDAGGIASLNHPNFHWAFDHHAIKDVIGATMMEVFNGHPGTNNTGGPDRYSTEEIWDGVLSSGRPIFGAAVDDSHHYHDYSSDMSNPGRGWIVVRSQELTKSAIVDALAKGDFYSSTGVSLNQLVTTQESISIEIEHYRNNTYKNVFETRFSGHNGVTLATSDSMTPVYKIRGDEQYIRATITSSNSMKAWTQPVFIKNHSD